VACRAQQFVRTVSGGLVVLALVLSASALAAVPPKVPSATASSNLAGARPVALAVSLRTELQCGRLIGGVLVVTLPRAMRVPGSIAASDVLVGSRAARSVAVAGRVVTVAVPLPRGVICDSIAPGVARIVFSRAAGLGNPKAPGTYTVKLRRGSDAFAAPLTIA
jgi:hypothetical protein